MSCPRTDALYRHPWPGQTDAERADLRAHAAECARCAAVVDRLGAAARALRADAVVGDARANAAAWAAISAQTARPAPWWPRALTYAAPVAALAVALGVLSRPTPEPGLTLESGVVLADGRALGEAVPTGVWLEAREAAVVKGPDLRLTAAPGARFDMAAKDLLRVDSGTVEVELASATARARIETRQVRLRTLGAALRVEAADGTRVELWRGAAEVEPTDGARLELVAPAVWTSATAPVSATAPPEPEPAAEPPAAPPAPAPSPAQRARAVNRAALTRARALVIEDGPEAKRIAEQVLERRAEGPEEVDALAVIADVHRRQGEHRAAAGFYARVAEHPAGEAYAEEARLRQAHMLFALGDADSALAALTVARRRFPGGVLAPERAALEAKAWLHKGDAARAATVLEAADARALAVQDACRDVANAIEASDPARARALVERSKKK